ncbi:hypothetical protein [Pseudosulfitobacter pseudonitzschiae]|uniref:hypothetical protein n=1 Tax=Pseudosulfitobacter pseudonitzschiae TaxID=1402135 RepID=UPI001AF8DDF3|nr:hypothetical protein [Pseudosulfitobacter pseudonitzschiae]MBM1833732.1 hypothetical protein [Pseudosulfitobacter pseudonitzschiae]MBM1838598.1 hypothetical protein [Pseudosulfitobacter pseudonitzschiae]MBM1842946.1 hypothetical protein [Pseudosulfitobacter pseudonitzschiae]MBM1847812.1 hypothetical protein [Pseudosulfitobacter pseudonitzschiae]MBM1853154.1 hypothetical protein [Pseudosulfitobacter pseudonitzschiae]
MMEACQTQAWSELYFGRDGEVIGRVIRKGVTGFTHQDLVIAEVNPDLPDADQIAADIATALNSKFT